MNNTKREMCEWLAALQSFFTIYEPAQIDFNSDAGGLHAGRVLNALRKHRIIASMDTISELSERMEKTPTTGPKMIDALIAEITTAAEGEAIPPPPPQDFAGCDLCHGGTISLPFPDGQRSVYCDCGRGRFLHSANGGNTICIANRPDLRAKAVRLKHEAEARAGGTLVRFGVDPEADTETQLRQFRQRIKAMSGGMFRDAKPKPAKRPISIEQAERALASVRPKPTPKPPQYLNPEALAAAAFANGDERGEIF